MDRQLLDELLQMKRRDVDTRTRLLAQGELYGAYAEEMQRVHRENAVRLDEIIDQHGWPGLSLVEIEGCRAAWLIAQHAICTPALQRKFLHSLTAAAEGGDAPWAQVAYLTDRIRFNEGRPQLYGTVLDWNEQGELSCDLEEPEKVDERRAAAGLPGFQDDLARHRKEVAAEGGRAPDDMDGYRRAASEWARSVGWR